jgi:hypothetical protein
VGPQGPTGPARVAIFHQYHSAEGQFSNLTEGLFAPCTGGYAYFQTPEVIANGTYQVSAYGAIAGGNGDASYEQQLQYMENGQWRNLRIRGSDYPDGNAPFNISWIWGNFGSQVMQVRVECSGSTSRGRLYGISMVNVG